MALHEGERPLRRGSASAARASASSIALTVAADAATTGVLPAASCWCTTTAASVATSSRTGRVQPSTQGTPPATSSAAKLAIEPRTSALWQHETITSAGIAFPASRTSRSAPGATSARPPNASSIASRGPAGVSKPCPVRCTTSKRSTSSARAEGVQRALLDDCERRALRRSAKGASAASIRFLLVLS